jgi:hypothetical protein
MHQTKAGRFNFCSGKRNSGKCGSGKFRIVFTYHIAQSWAGKAFFLKNKPFKKNRLNWTGNSDWYNLIYAFCP